MDTGSGCTLLAVGTAATAAIPDMMEPVGVGHFVDIRIGLAAH
jgi:hypothetical protein